MDYEKAYNEALSRAKSFLELKRNDRISNDDVEFIFPELKESEDEKIKKVLAGFFKSYKEQGTYGAETFNGISTDDILSWLEKQGKQRPVVTPNFKVGDRIIAKSFDECDCSTIKEIKDGKYIFDDGYFIDIEEQNLWELVEQNHIDKIEPKFKIEEGKWYVCIQTFVLRGKIVVIKGSTYQAREDNAIQGEDGCLFIDKHDGKGSEYFRPWTIQDAKDGYVLCYKDEVFLYKHDIKNCTKKETSFGGMVYYCCYDGKRFITDSMYSLTEKDKNNIHPATKEQRDLLFSKMHEAGYEWDTEKKELKKLELSCFESALFSAFSDAWQSYLQGEEVNVEQWTKEHSKELLETAKEELKEQNSAWSEEDEYTLYETIQHLEELIRIDKAKHCGVDVQYYQRDIDFIKSLKNRVLPQPKQEWSEEDERVIKLIESSTWDGEKLTQGEAGIVHNWLKAIRERYIWNPSKEQMKALDIAIRCGIQLGSWEEEALKSLKEQLTKLIK